MSSRFSDPTDDKDPTTRLAESVAWDRQHRPNRPPAVPIDDWNNPYHWRGDTRPVFMFDRLDVQLRSAATPHEIGDYARVWANRLSPTAANIEPLLAVSNEISLHRRPLQPRAALADAIHSKDVDEWARVLLYALLSPGFAALAARDREALVRLHSTLVARLLGAKLDTRSRSTADRRQ
jgi:hypothetical protein